MATLSHGPRINARTTPEIHNAVKRLGINATARGISFSADTVAPVRQMVSVTAPSVLPKVETRESTIDEASDLLWEILNK